ncbi:MULTISPECIES: hypothetical protein [Pseudomonas]|jgi:predicted small secreted protein|uniref:hypothetical protein n=1 Tax=Pseudomonas TaxID=286 RepID=UPI000365AB19|nr:MULTISPECIES: hypothetical protein [unclassified Pseudomonas]MDY0831489.1 hypothetical protein [Pseudomonas sp. SED1]OLY73824.1 hypothetical protein AU074_29385 [Pseudomonas sp. ATCC PTA-122608]
MLGKVSKKYLVWGAVALCATLLSGCATSRYDGKHAPDPSKAIIVGSIGESYLMQPHGLVVEIRQKGGPGTVLRLTTLGNEDDQPSPNILGHFFMYEVPPGEYEYTQWSYVYYAGRSMPRPVPAVFSVKAGETLYIGDLRADALRFCLSNVNNAENTVEELKRKYRMLKDRNIVNLTAKSGFAPWPSSDATDFGKGLCTL